MSKRSTTLVGAAVALALLEAGSTRAGRNPPQAGDNRRSGGDRHSRQLA